MVDLLRVVLIRGAGPTAFRARADAASLNQRAAVVEAAHGAGAAAVPWM
jgi:hypothetical protein